MESPEDDSPSETDMIELPRDFDMVERIQNDDLDTAIRLRRKLDKLGYTLEDVRHALKDSAKNVRLVLQRQLLKDRPCNAKRPICRFKGARGFYKSMKDAGVPLELLIFTIARVWDEAHIRLCKVIASKRKGNTSYDEFLIDPCVNLRTLRHDIEKQGPDAIDKKIKLEFVGPDFEAKWENCPIMKFDNLERLDSLEGLLPGESVESEQYSGIGGGGGSDIISASLLGHLIGRHKKTMNLLVSTRTWNTGSQGKEGDVIGIKRQVYNATPCAKPGTYKIREDTHAEGRDLETIPLPHHPDIFMVLDQGESTDDIPEEERVKLEEQLSSVLSPYDEIVETHLIVDNALFDATRPRPHVNTIMSVDTGGDVFGTDGTDGTTPDQDFRVQKAINDLPAVSNQQRGLVTVVVAPGVDAPPNAPQKAEKAGGKVYKPTVAEKEMFLKILKEYGMDGSNPKRFGKTTLALQECLRGKEGWTSLNLPNHVINTWENPWSSFVFIQKCMSDIIFMPTRELLKEIEPHQSNGSRRPSLQQ